MFWTSFSYYANELVSRVICVGISWMNWNHETSRCSERGWPGKTFIRQSSFGTIFRLNGLNVGSLCRECYLINFTIWWKDIRWRPGKGANPSQRRAECSIEGRTLQKPHSSEIKLTFQRALWCHIRPVWGVFNANFAVAPDFPDFYSSLISVRTA